MVKTASLGGDIYSIDNNALGLRNYCSSYVVSSEGEHVLVETGPSTSSRTLLDGIRALDFDLRSFTNVILTHIHFDHAGGVGNILDNMPSARVAVHEIGAKHIIDPSRLIESAKRVFGESLSLYGEFKPVPEDRVHSMRDGDEIAFQTGRRLRILYAPGHAPHEICISDKETGSLFTGDAVGLYFEDTHEIVPTTPPPDFDFDAANNTIDMLMRSNPSRLLFSHYGVATQVETVFMEAKRQLKDWGDKILQTFSESPGGEVEKFKRLSSILEIRTRVLPTALKYEHRSNSIKGYLRYFRKKRNLQL